MEAVTLVEFLAAMFDHEDRSREESRWYHDLDGKTRVKERVPLGEAESWTWWRRDVAEVEAKRRIIERARLVLDSWAQIEAGQSEAAAYPDVTRREASFWRATLADMATIYADHEDYREAWKP